jgi:hypothetical protein
MRMRAWICKYESANPPDGVPVHVVCGRSPSDCAPAQGVDTVDTRLCATSAECTAGLPPGTTSMCVDPGPRDQPHVRSCTLR